MFTFLLYNRQPLDCDFKHNNKTILLEGEKKKICITKIVFSIAALILAGIGVVLLLCGYCKTKNKQTKNREIIELNPTS